MLRMTFKDTIKIRNAYWRENPHKRVGRHTEGDLSEVKMKKESKELQEFTQVQSTKWKK